MKNFKLSPQLRELFRQVAALKDDEHWAVWICLMEEDVKSLTGLTKTFDSSYHELLPILENLIEGGLVEQFIIFEDEWADLDRRYYRATTFGIIWYARLFESLIPSRLSRMPTQKRMEELRRKLNEM